MSVLEQPPTREVDQLLISFDVDPGVLLSRAPVPMQMLQVALDELGRINPADLPEDQALALGSALVSAQDQIQALALRSVADVDTRGLHTQDGYGTTGAWVADQQTSMGRDAVSLARKINRLPQLAERVAAGAISVKDATVVGQALDRLRPHVDQADGLIDGQSAEEALSGVLVDGVCQLVGQSQGGLPDGHALLVHLEQELRANAAAPLTQLTRLEAAFLLLARHVASKHLRAALAVLVNALLPNELAERSEDAHRNRGLELVRDVDGQGWRLRGWLDDECGELLQICIAAAMDKDPDNVADTAAAAAARAAGEEPDLLDPQAGGCIRPRSRTQRRHDALRLILQKLIDSKALGSRNKQPVQIGVTISAAALHGQPGGLPARTDSGAIVPAVLVRRWLCDSAITRFVMSLGNKVVELSHTDRTAKPHERRIKLVETGGVCEAAGCSRGTATGHALIPHHAVPYKQDQTTSLADTVLFCEVSHDDVHVGGKTLRLKNGRWLNERGWTTGP